MGVVVHGDIPNPLTHDIIKEMVDQALRGAQARGDVNVAFVDEKKGAELNMRYRKKEGATNVLSFSDTEEEGVLGDIVLTVPVIEREAQQSNEALEKHVQRLVVHGVLHLVGYSHHTTEETERMESLEAKILHSNHSSLWRNQQ